MTSIFFFSSTGARMKSLQYRSHRYSLRLLHYGNHMLEFSSLTEWLMHGDYGLAQCRKAAGLNSVAVTDGDELPEGCWEAVHVPNAFSGTTTEGKSVKGDALGFLHPDGIEWLVFDRDIEELVNFLMVDSKGRVCIGKYTHLVNFTETNDAGDTDKKGRLFDHVGVIEKGNEGKRGVKEANPAHRKLVENLNSSVSVEEDRPFAFIQSRRIKDLNRRLLAVYHKWELFKEAGYDISEAGYDPKLAHALRKPDLAEKEGNGEYKDE
ncbi:hypothetical protein DM02DRAFT_651142 [Periconia macrospinosa]|uniref:Uncharacterized protein n=1 Tax=Periconia macrospinosa TaxID=97972 RepID=A0A2V1E494_9PLEO|nr:hypothetical protein DM02DRAFT_651142 [Periconia macrospinosa]